MWAMVQGLLPQFDQFFADAQEPLVDFYSLVSTTDMADETHDLVKAIKESGLRKLAADDDSFFNRLKGVSIHFAERELEPEG